MGRKLDHITFYRPGFKLVMARKEIRKMNGDLIMPPEIFKRVAERWHKVRWDALPDHPSVRGLLHVLHQRREQHCPVYPALFCPY
jgi:hypothetical protein